MIDTYRTIEGPATGEFRDRGSKFIAYAFPISDGGEWQEHLEVLRKEHPKARHHCFAWRLGIDGNNFRANDDGEPSGTAGRPILGQIDSFGLTNIVVIVVRYFGGTKLGTSGLIHAYKTSTAEALRNAVIVERTIDEVFSISFGYDRMGAVMGALEKTGLEMVSQEFGDKGRVLIAIRKSEVQPVMTELRARIAGITLEEAAAIEEVEGVEIQYQYTR